MTGIVIAGSFLFFPNQREQELERERDAPPKHLVLTYPIPLCTTCTIYKCPAVRGSAATLIRQTCHQDLRQRVLASAARAVGITP